jgi:perosamine synthetase
VSVDSGVEDRRFPVALPDVGELEIEYAAAAVRSTWISSVGEYLDQFESEFAAACGVEHAIAVANGTVALHLALSALGVGPGDEVIVPSLTYIASVNSITYTGATPVFADVDPDTWCIDPAHVESLIGPRTRGIIPVHLYGNPADMTRLRQIATRHDLFLVEDAAEAPFATVNEVPTGGLGDVGTFSFFGNKILTSGEGGAVTTNDSRLAERLRLLRGQGMDPHRRYFFPVVGYNYRLTNVAAALLCAQMSRREEMMGRRHVLFGCYDETFVEDIRFQLQQVPVGATRSPWLYTLLVTKEGGVDRDEVMARLGTMGVETRPIFIPIHTLPPYQHLRGDQLSVTEDLAARGFSLPTSSAFTASDGRQIVARLLSVLGP